MNVKEVFKGVPEREWPYRYAIQIQKPSLSIFMYIHGYSSVRAYSERPVVIDYNASYKTLIHIYQIAISQIRQTAKLEFSLEI